MAIVSKPTVICFGEILWDCLPRGLFLGGAPLNGAGNLAQLGHAANIISAVGDDFLGNEALRRIRQLGVGTDFASQIPDLPTGVVIAELDAAGDAEYDFPEPVAWDAIPVNSAVVGATQQASALVYGSLALRRKVNRNGLGKLLDVAGPLKCFDVNLRPPIEDMNLVRDLARRADLVKLNEDELARLTGFEAAKDQRGISDQCMALAKSVSVDQICVTLGSNGAVFWKEGATQFAPAQKIEVRDTVGAGDAFMAALVAGLVAELPISEVLANACARGGEVASRNGALG